MKKSYISIAFELFQKSLVFDLFVNILKNYKKIEFRPETVFFFKMQ